MSTSEFKTKIGAIVVNLQSLEFALRTVLGASDELASTTTHLGHVRAGDRVPEDRMTNYDSLGLVIRKVNQRLAELGVSEQVDDSVVQIRDAIAHGRVFSLHPDGPYRLVKFAKPLNGEVVVAMVAELTLARLDQEIGRTGSELLKVVRLARRVGLNCFPEI